ncbi:hypothetical protein [Streptoalloteichus hindustanus]|nr:hypothetical protein [Streptoalloteichus hindustanus]
MTVAVALGCATAALSAPASPAEDTPPPLVEDYSYPGAAKILQERGITLIKGDGHILLMDACPSDLTGVLAVRSRGSNPACFQVRGTTGYLTMKIPNVIFVKGTANTVSATVSNANGEKSYAIRKEEWTEVGEAANDPASTLLSLSVKP